MLARETLLQLIGDFRKTHAYGPSVRDLADLSGLSSSTVQYHLDKLRQLGLVTSDGKPGSLALTRLSA